MDVAALGLEVQSADVPRATKELNELSVAAARAQANAAKLAKQRFGAEQSYAAARAAQNMARASELAARAEGNLSKEQMEVLRNARLMANAHSASARAKLEEARAADALARSLNKEAQEALRAAQADRDRVPAANQNVRGASGARGFETANILSQFQDIGVTAAMGINPLMIAVQQGTQLTSVLMTMEKPLQGIATAFMGLIGVTSLLTIGMIALVAALIQWVDWGNVAVTVINFVAKNLQTIAPYAVAAAAALALIYAPTIIGGIISLIALLGRIGAAAMTAGVQMAAAWVIASGPIGWLITGFATVLAALYVFRDEIAKAIGVDVLGVVVKAVNAIIGVFVGGFEGIKATWSLLPAALGDIVMATANAVITGVESMVNKVAASIDAFIGKINAAIANVPGMSGVQIGTIGQVKFGRVTNPYEGAANRVQGALGSAISSAMGRDYVGGAFEAIGNGAEWASGKVKELGKWVEKVTADDAKAKGGKGRKGGGGKTATDKFEDIVNGAERRIAELQAERDAIGLSEEATLRLRYETELLNQAKQKDISLSPQQADQLRNLAAQMAHLEVETKKAKEAFDFAKDATRGFLSDLRQGLMNGESFWQAFGNAAMNVLDKIADKLLNDVVDALFQTSNAAGGLFGGGSGGGGLLGGLFSWLFSAKGNAFGRGGLKMFAKGGAFTNSIVTSPTLFKFAKGAGMMGEAGPEAIMPLSRDANGRLGVTALDTRGGANDNSPVVVAGAFDVFVNEDGNWEAKVREISTEQSTKTFRVGINAFSTKELPSRMEQINKNPRRRG